MLRCSGNGMSERLGALMICALMVVPCAAKAGEDLDDLLTESRFDYQSWADVKPAVRADIRFLDADQDGRNEMFKKMSGGTPPELVLEWRWQGGVQSCGISTNRIYQYRIDLKRQVTCRESYL